MTDNQRQTILAAYRAAYSAVFKEIGDAVESDQLGHQAAHAAYQRLHPEVANKTLIERRVAELIAEERDKDPERFWTKARAGVEPGDLAGERTLRGKPQAVRRAPGAAAHSDDPAYDPAYRGRHRPSGQASGQPGGQPGSQSGGQAGAPPHGDHEGDHEGEHGGDHEGEHGGRPEGKPGKRRSLTGFLRLKGRAARRGDRPHR